MFIQEVIIDGFKSYAKRTVVSGFDQQFNAITGLNGSGKSNILDAICFVLGISTLSQVRVSSLEELVYKQGKAGVQKASVTIVFNNADREQSPVGYEACETITVTRQVVIGGRNKYLINGHAATAQRVQNLFHSVQLNVNNPHFLIMQGRITKVLNMKPPEILGMIEEAAGTRMFETKKEKAKKTIDKKEVKVQEINKILAEEITPQLERLQSQRRKYQRYKQLENEIERDARFVVAADYAAALAQQEGIAQEITALSERARAARANADAARLQAAELEARLQEIERQRAETMSGEYKQLLDREQELNRELVTAQAAQAHATKAVKAEEAKAAAAERQLEEARASLQRVRAALATSKQAADAATKAVEAADAEVEAAETAVQHAAAGMETAQDGEEAGTLQEQLMAARAAVDERSAAAEAATLTAKFKKGEAAEAAKVLKAKAGENRSLQAAVAAAADKARAARAAVNGLGFDPAQEQALHDRRAELRGQTAQLEQLLSRQAVSGLTARCQFSYDRAAMARSKGFQHDAVRGTIANLINVADMSFATALEVAAGGRLFQVVVDTAAQAAALLKHGRLRHRVTFVPLDKVRARGLSQQQVARARQLGGDKVRPALDLVRPVAGQEAAAPAVQYAFGSHLVCDDAETAKRVAFDRGVRAVCVTRDGDVFDPNGTVEGGSRPGGDGPSLLQRLAQVQQAKARLDAAQSELRSCEARLAELEAASSRFEELAGSADLAEEELRLTQQRADTGEYAEAEVAAEKAKMDAEAQQKAAKLAKKQLEAARARVGELQEQMADAEGRRRRLQDEAEQRLQAARAAAKSATEAAAGVVQAAQEAEVEAEGAAEEEAQAAAALAALASSLATRRQQAEAQAEVVATAQAAFEAAEAALADRRAQMAAADEEMTKVEGERRAAAQRQEAGKAEAETAEAEAKRKRDSNSSAEQFRRRALREHPWIAEQQQFFGQPGTDFDFAARSRDDVQRRLRANNKERQQLEREVNKKVMSMIDTVEREHTELQDKKRTIENDKTKIQRAIRELEIKKEEALHSTWGKVTTDFGSIFSTLLPGAAAKLEPEEGKTVLDGLQVRVAFGGVWKDSLSELSGGQRSLLALSLILSLLLFKPAPMYILDEVDAALDLSHTQNIGRMIRTHFGSSQFVVVSLKQGMFSNANVVFRTKFVDGSSTVTRTTPNAAARAAGAAAGGGGSAAGGSRRATAGAAADDEGAEEEAAGQPLQPARGHRANPRATAGASPAAKRRPRRARRGAAADGDDEVEE